MTNPWQPSAPAGGLGDAGRIRARTIEAPPPYTQQISERLLQQRIIFLGQEVDDEIANRLCAELLLLSAEDPERDIFLYINSPGGSVTAGMAIYDMMEFVPNDVCTVAIGFAASMGQVLLTSGAPGKRYALPYTRVMMHQPSGGIGGTASDIAIQAEQMVHVKQVLADRIAAHSGQTAEQVRADWDRDRWFNAEEAKRYGLIDQVIRNATHLSADGVSS